MKLVECVPNISEGQDDGVIDAIAKAASDSGANVLDIDRGRSTNRTVITFVANPESAAEAAFSLIRRASELIDMRKHKGEHPRIGATDVFPFVPLDGVSMDECAELARKVGKRVAEELQIPVYLYGEAAVSPERASLSFLRQGEYEGIPAKFKDPEMAPDFGEAVLNAKSGITVIGARPFLIAYNINLNTKERRLAQEIAFKIRESGRKKRGPDGSFLLDETGQALIEPGIFRHCAAVGWFIDEFGIAQVSINLTNFEVTSIQTVFDTVCRLADERGLRVSGSEIVGLVPKKALIGAGRHYLRKQGASIAVPETDLYFSATKSLGLNDLYPFAVKEKVIEEKIKMEEPLANSRLNEFVDSLSRGTPAPGGGSASALAGASGAALVSMVSALSFAKAALDDTAKRTVFEQSGEKAQRIKADLVQAIDDDTHAFDRVMDAYRIKAATPEEKAEKEKKIIAAYKEASTVPLGVAKKCLEVMTLARDLLSSGLASTMSDSAVGVQLAHAGLLGASYNVQINLKELKKKADSLTEEDVRFLAETEKELAEILKQAREILPEIDI